MTNFFANAPKLKRRLITTSKLLAGAVVVIAVLGFFVIPAVAKRVAVSQLSKQLGRKVAIDKVKVNPFALSLAVEGFTIFEPDGATPFVGFRRLYVNAQLSSVFRLAPVVKQVSLESLRVNVVRLKATPDDLADLNAYNFSDILGRFVSAAPSPDPPAPASSDPPKFSVNNIGLVDAQITFDDRPQHKTHTIADLNVGIPFVSNLPVFVENLVEPGLNVIVDGAPFSVRGKAKPFKETLETVVRLKVDDFDLTKFVSYVPMKFAFDVTSALLDLDLEAAFVRTSTPSLLVKGRVALERLSLQEHASKAPVIAFDVFEIFLGKADVTAMAFVVDAIRLSRLDVGLRRDSSGRLNLLDLIPPSGPPSTPKPETKSALPKVDVAALKIEQAHIHLTDQAVSPTFDADIGPVDVSVFDVSTAPGKRGRMQASLSSSVGLSLRSSATFSVEPLTVDGSVAVDNLLPARFAPYFQTLVGFDITNGALRLGTDFNFTQADPPRISLTKAFFEVRELSLRKRRAQPNDAFFSVKSLSVSDVAVNPQTTQVTVGSVASQGLTLKAERAADGSLDLAALVATAAPTAAPMPPAQPASPTWAFTLQKLDVAAWSVRLHDRTVRPAATLAVDLAKATANNLTNRKNTRGNFDFRVVINKRARLSIAGQAGLDPVNLNAKLGLNALELVPFQPYFSDQVNMTLTDGTLAINGDVTFEATKAGAHAGFQGGIDVADFVTVEGTDAKPLAGWKKLSIAKLNVGLNEGAPAPLRVAVGEIALADFFAYVSVSADGKPNLQNVARASASPKSEPTPEAKPAEKAATATPESAKPTPPPPVSIDRMVISNGHVRYDDQTVKPAYFTEITQLNGTIKGLSSSQDTRAEVAISGTIDHSGRLSITGATNPLAKDLFLDLKVDVNEVELPPASPFSGKFVGYNIAKGKLGLSLNYKIDNNKLKATNHLVLDQFTFGEKVASPDALNLPVRFAVALLKDRHGVIDLDVPIAGSLDDPEFRIAAAVLKVLGNLVVKAATAPFSLIASAFEGDDESAFVDFAPGSSTPDAKARAKLSKLAKALQDRPGLSFELQGSADATGEVEVLRRALLERKLRAAKLDDLVKSGASVKAIEDVTVSASERPPLIERVYKAEPFAKPKTVFGGIKALPTPEMEKAIASHIVVKDSDLNELAMKRAAAVKEAVAKQAPDVGARLFTVSPIVGKTKGRVEFKFKQD